MLLESYNDTVFVLTVMNVRFCIIKYVHYVTLYFENLFLKSDKMKVLFQRFNKETILRA